MVPQGNILTNENSNVKNKFTSILQLQDFKTMNRFLKSPWKKYYLKVYGNLRQLGYDTIQFLGHSDMRCGNNTVEIVDVHGVGLYACGSKTNNPRLRTGYNATLPCKCDNKKIYSNCIHEN